MCMYMWRKWGEATQHLQSKTTLRATQVPLRQCLRINFTPDHSAVTSPTLMAQPLFIWPILPCATTHECYCNAGRESGMCSRASASAAPVLKPPVREASLLVYRGICYGPASSTKTGHLSLGFSSQLGYHVTVPRAGQLCLWVSQGLGTTQVRSAETRTQPHSLAPHGEVCVYRDTQGYTELLLFHG